MVANELADDDSQLEVRIIRTKGGIRNVAYIAENENELIVHKKTTSAEVPGSNPNIGKNDQNLQDNFHDLEISKSRLNQQNLLKQFSSQSAGYQHSKFFNNRVSPLTNSTGQSEVEIPKVLKQTNFSNNLEKDIGPQVQKNLHIEYRSYPCRWCLLWTIALLNVANNAHWISYASVYSKVVVFYHGATKEEITRILTVSYGLGIPFSIIAPIVVSKYGLRFGLYTGAFLTFIGSLLCCVSTFPGLMTEENGIPPIVWYWMTLVGQALTGMACPFLACIPTKVSQGWFNEKQGPMATAVIGLSQPIGIVLGQGITPLFVQEPSDVPLLNIVWFVPAAVGLILALTTIKSSLPPTPPSRSAHLVSEQGSQECTSYLRTLKSLLTNLPCILLSVCIGGAMGYISGFQTMLEPILCVLGYSNYFSGLCGALVFIFGILGSFILGFLLHWIGKHHAVILVKVMISILALVFASLIYVMQLPNQPILIAFMCSIFGFVSIGSYPTLLELAVEATYPICEALTVSLISVSASVQGVTIMELDHYLAKPIPENVTSSHSITCHGDDLMPVLDHTNYLYVSNGYVIIWSIVFVLFFKTKFHRTAANNQHDGTIVEKYTENGDLYSL